MSERVGTSRAGGGPLGGYLGRDPALWQGFAAHTLDELASSYPFAEGEGRAFRGELGIAYRFRALARHDFADPFFFHFLDDRLAFIETDFWSLDEAQCRAALDKLGPPAHRLVAYFRDSKIARADWAYPDRGIALCVMPETSIIARWTAFSPCSIDTYRQRFRNVSLTQEFEAR